MSQLKWLLILVLGIFTLTTCLTSEALPRGNYFKTCRKCRMHGRDHNKLVCKCLTRNQRWRKTRLHDARYCRFVQNINGHLKCTGGRVWPLPRGSYKQTCFNCKYNGQRLKCRCPRRNQTIKKSVLFNADRCFRIRNINGHLRCIRF